MFRTLFRLKGPSPMATFCSDAFAMLSRAASIQTRSPVYLVPSPTGPNSVAMQTLFDRDANSIWSRCSYGTKIPWTLPQRNHLPIVLNNCKMDFVEATLATLALVCKKSDTVARLYRYSRDAGER